jgi:hypothetical protein
MWKLKTIVNIRDHLELKIINVKVVSADDFRPSKYETLGLHLQNGKANKKKSKTTSKKNKNKKNKKQNKGNS